MLFDLYRHIMTSSYKVMKEDISLAREFMTEEDWLEGIFSESESHASLKNAKTSIRTFDYFCKSKLEIPDPDYSDLKQQRIDELESGNKSKQARWEAERNYFDAVDKRRNPILKQARLEIIGKYQKWYEVGDIQSICTSLQSFVTFCRKDHPEVKTYRFRTWKAKKTRAIKSYFATIKDYLRRCHGVRITNEDVKDYIKFPKDGKQQPEPLELDMIKLILAHADPVRTALYYVYLTSGMREGEGLSLKRSNFKTDVRPIRIHLHAKDTKGNEARDTYISEEAWERVKPIYDATPEGKYLFHDYEEIHEATQNESRYFIRLREKIATKYGHKEPCDEFPNGNGILKRYENSCRHTVHIHAMRAYFMTVAEGIHGNNYAHALAGHHTYLDQYIRKPEKQKAKMYLELEKYLLLESSRVHSEQFHEQELEDLKEAYMQQQKQIERLQRGEYQRKDFADAERFGVTS